MGQNLGLVAFDLEEVIPTFIDDGSSQFTLAVQRVGRDGLAFQRGQSVDQSPRRTLFTAGRSFLLIHNGQSHGRTTFRVG